MTKSVTFCAYPFDLDPGRRPDQRTDAEIYASGQVREVAGGGKIQLQLTEKYDIDALIAVAGNFGKLRVTIAGGGLMTTRGANPNPNLPR